jgi:DNA-3-methyladenine glycosylase
VPDPLRDLLSLPSYRAAPALLGCLLGADSPEGRVVVQLTEVEAYDGSADPASHAFRGRTARNAVMFGPPGRLYVYFSYGMHWCANVVTGADGEASAVLLRAGRVVAGVELARQRRGPRVADRSLARGPACLTQALGIGRDSYGADLLAGGHLWLEQADSDSDSDSDSAGGEIMAGPRVGISSAADVAWRFYVGGDDTVSAYRRSTRGRTAAD